VLHHYLFDGTLSDDDVGRVGHGGEWIPVVDLRRMFEEDGFTRQAVRDAASAAPPGTRTAAGQAIERLAQAMPRAVPKGNGPGWLRRQLDGVTGTLDSLAGRLSDLLVGLATVAIRALRLRTVQLALVCLAAAGIAWGIVLPNWPLSVEEELAAYRGLLIEMQTLKGSDAPAEWDAVEAKMQSKIADTGPRIRAAATSLRPDFQNLMWAIDLFPKALAEARGGETPTASVVAMVDRHLDQSGRFIQRQAQLARQRPPVERRVGKTLAIGGGILGVFVVVAWRWRRRAAR
jgi:hypothetical protein